MKTSGVKDLTVIDLSQKALGIAGINDRFNLIRIVTRSDHSFRGGCISLVRAKAQKLYRSVLSDPIVTDFFDPALICSGIGAV